MSTSNYSTITIKKSNDDYLSFRRPDDFAPQREDIYSAEYTTMSGNTVADRVGWKYADMELSWSALTQTEVAYLISISGPVTLVFDDPSGRNINESIIRTSAVAMRHRYEDTEGNTIYWRDVKMSIRFITAH